MKVQQFGKLANWAAATSLVLAVGQLGFSATGDWPQWQGPNRDNLSTETGLLKDWPASGPPIAWEIKGLGDGYSSVSIAGGKIFTMGSFANDPPTIKVEPKIDPKTGKPKPPPFDETTYAITCDLAGTILWKTAVGKTGDGGGYHGPRSTPTVDGDRVYVLTDMGELACLAVADGKEIWHINLQKDLGGGVPGWGYAESITIEGNNLLCCPGGKKGTVAALNKMTGEVIWRSKDFTDNACHASLVPADIGGAHQYVILTPSSVAGIGTDGSLLWKAARKGSTAIIATPVVRDNLVFVTSGYGVGANMFKVEGSSTSLKAEEVYGGNKDMAIHHGGVICLDDVVYGATDKNKVEAISLKDGSLIWKNDSVGKGSIAYAEGRLYVRSEGSGNIALIEATREGYKEHGLLKQVDRSHKSAWAHPVIAGGKLYIRDQDIMLCYDIKAK